MSGGISLPGAVDRDHDVDGASRAGRLAVAARLDVQGEAGAPDPGGRHRNLDGVAEPDASVPVDLRADDSWQGRPRWARNAVIAPSNHARYQELTTTPCASTSR
jgi:hypothetical protein